MLKIFGIILVLTLSYTFLIKNNDLETLMQETTQFKTEKSGLKTVTTTDLYSLSELGMYTVVELYAESCSSCRKLKKHYSEFLPLRPDVAVRRIQLPNNWSAKSASEKYSVDVRSTPHVLIFDKEGKLMLQDEGRDKTAYVTLQKWIYKTLNKRT